MKVSIDDLRQLASLDAAGLAALQDGLDKLDAAGVSVNATGGKLTIELKKPPEPEPVPVSTTRLADKVANLEAAAAAVSEELHNVANTIKGMNDDKERKRTLKATRKEILRVMDAPPAPCPNPFTAFEVLQCGGARTARMLHSLVDHG